MRRDNKFINTLFYLLVLISLIFIIIRVRYINRMAVTNTQFFSTNFKIRKSGFENEKVIVKEEINVEVKEEEKKLMKIFKIKKQKLNKILNQKKKHKLIQKLKKKM